MSQVVTIKTTHVAHDIDTIINECKEKEDFEFCFFLLNLKESGKLKKIIAECANMAIKKVSTFPGFSKGETVTDYFKKTVSSLGNLKIIASLKTANFDRGLGICLQDCSLVFVGDNYEQSAGAQKIIAAFSAIFRKIFLEEIFCLLGFNVISQEERPEENFYHTIVEEEV